MVSSEALQAVEPGANFLHTHVLKLCVESKNRFRMLVNKPVVMHCSAPAPPIYS